ncbi:DUF2946 domain-containing protein [Rugamonas sp. DEMB1]|uniref:DUF2946 domain-containing protein n=1 Tax=Rugamonas sp. DEMB1 TaxID=3039386 RepID=UPI0028BE7CBE|nr:DUF2946 domain-containing protein [Rugamonas sp. DEMB1]
MDSAGFHRPARWPRRARPAFRYNYFMARKPTIRLWQIWLACCAILLNALAPSISHAIAFANGQPTAWEVCRSDGSRLTPAPAGTTLAQQPASGREPQQQRGIKLDDCGYCATHAGSFGLPPAGAVSAGLFDLPRLQPPLFYRSPSPLTAWSAGRPRGPPAV